MRFLKKLAFYAEMKNATARWWDDIFVFYTCYAIGQNWENLINQSPLL